MANGFRLINRRVTAGQILKQKLGAASTQFTDGDAIKFTNGTVTPCSAQTDKPMGFHNAMITPSSVMRPATRNLTTTAGEFIQYVPGEGGLFEFETDLTGTDAPPINGTAVNSGSTTTALVTAAGSTSDYIGGTIYFPGTDTHHKITGDTVSGGVHTFTFVPLAPRAIAATDTAIAVPFTSESSQAVKLSSGTVSQGISCAVADKSGGSIKIAGVDLKNLKVRVTCPYLT